MERNLKKTLLFALGLALAVSANASYELLLVADVSNEVVHRIDPVSKAYFGSFGAGIFKYPKSIAINQSNGRAYVFDSIREKIYTFEYSTGLLLSSFSTAAYRTFATSYGYLSLASNGDILMGLSYGGGFRFNTAGALVATYNKNAGSAGLTKVIEGNDGAIYGADWVTSKVSRYNAAGGNPLQNSSTQLAYWDMARTPTSAVGLLQNGITKFSLNSSMTNIQTATFASLGLDSASNLATGHGDVMYVSGASGGTARLYRFDSSDLTLIDSAVYPQIASYEALATVIAPEPASLTALLVGPALLLRRRRR